ncbi:hypothetical protein ACF09E_13320 [Streptomyces sp. NPDC014891]|uniref:hypothetical protein n=1 Tax=Streptomyces sp. NPDC014891 TaxID=3364929 RepID=UPI0036FB860E
MVALWQRAQPDRVPVITTELATAREDLLRAEDANDEVTPAELRAEWQGRVRRLLATHPELAEDLRTLLTEFTAVDAPGPAVAQHATASGQGRVYQAGRDMHLGQG